MIKSINEITKNESMVFGNKAANLGQLSAKVKVPQGIALSTLLFDEFMEDAGFPFGTGDYLGKNNEIQSYLKQHDFNPPVIAAIENELLNMPSQFIVRSSAICEDSKNNSMAGMFISKEVSKKEDVFPAIIECYNSLFTDKTLEYAHDQKIDFSLLKMGVIIQEYIEGLYSGVIFTADPQNHDTGIMYINYVAGKCSGFVDGSEKSFFLKVNKESKEIIENNLGETDIKLPDGLISTLIETALLIELETGYHADIEWTYNQDGLYILQARPITTLKTKRAKFEADKNEKEFDWFLFDFFKQKSTLPLYEEFFGILFSLQGQGLIETGYRGRYAVMKCVNGYMYLNERKMENEEEKRKAAKKRLSEHIKEGLSIFEDCCLPKLLPIKKRMDGYIANKENISDNDIASFIKASIEYENEAAIIHWEATLGATYLEDFYGYLNETYGEISIEEMYDLIYVKTIKTEEREMLLDIAEYIKASKDLLKIINSSPHPVIIYERLKLAREWPGLFGLIHKYLLAYGMYAAQIHKYNHFSYILWDKPQYIFSQIKKILSQNKSDYLKSIKAIEERKEKVFEKIVGSIDLKFHEEFKRNLAVAEKTFASVENHHYYCEDIHWGYIKMALNFAAERLVKKELLSSADDIYYLKFEEINEILNSNIINVDINKRKYEYEENNKILAPNMILSNASKKAGMGNPPDLMKVDGEVVLSGMSSMNKKVEGTILVGPHVPDHISSDCILVVVNGHMGDLFPIIGKIKGLIVQNGSPFDHMGIITREMNVPALYNVKDAVSILKTGDNVILDGEKGICIVINKS